MDSPVRSAALGAAQVPLGHGGEIVSEQTPGEFSASARAAFAIELARLKSAGVNNVAQNDFNFAVFHLGFCAGAQHVVGVYKETKA